MRSLLLPRGCQLYDLQVQDTHHDRSGPLKEGYALGRAVPGTMVVSLAAHADARLLLRVLRAAQVHELLDGNMAKHSGRRGVQTHRRR